MFPSVPNFPPFLLFPTFPKFSTFSTFPIFFYFSFFSYLSYFTYPTYFTWSGLVWSGLSNIAGSSALGQPTDWMSTLIKSLSRFNLLDWLEFAIATSWKNVLWKALIFWVTGKSPSCWSWMRRRDTWSGLVPHIACCISQQTLLHLVWTCLPSLNWLWKGGWFRFRFSFKDKN